MKWDLLGENALIISAMAVRTMYEHKTGLTFYCSYDIKTDLHVSRLLLTRARGNYQCYQMIRTML